ncbi:leucine-rich repeat domain-containing protein [Acinetobacter lwoffii]|uniref:leucine-rich repeat domain-containing protein n=1 Tax=Acinetobacter lwoffii TaxID=28090 RepID=UPI002DBF7572|nr:leucine-rich repeat domain-containing protein [Acinetobacter lwoffii]MEB6680294.1 leucine-rich repeat domain-containing protein [Acinetobacter lwoffii]
MPIYTGTADANGDFDISFGANSYTSGEKITITAEKDAATKSIELYAPSEVVGGGNIRFTGSVDDFPNNIGGVEIHGIIGIINANAFSAVIANSIWTKATSLKISDGVTSIGTQAFRAWGNALSLQLPDSITSMGANAFDGWNKATELTIPNSIETIPTYCFNAWYAIKSLVIPDNVRVVANQAFNDWRACLTVDIGAGVENIGVQAMYNLAACNEIICRATTPPAIQSNTFQNLKSTCVIKVPAGSIAAYQAAANWSAFAARIQAI